LNLIAGILAADGGRVELDGIDLAALPEAKRDRLRADKIGYIFQTFNLLQGYTVLENVLLGMSFGPRGVDRAHAVELLREGITSLAAEGSVKRSTVRALPPPVAFDADDQALLNQTVGYYHERLLATTEAAEYLAARGLVHPELVAYFKLGVADRTLGLRLPDWPPEPGRRPH
jgi:ABC-type Fe3+/spermidine/putrescine transport system ATPase subunit